MSPHDISRANGTTCRFCLAGLEVTLLDAGAPATDSNKKQPTVGGEITGKPVSALAGLRGFYDRYPSSGAPAALELRFERVPGFGQARPRGPEYPGFRSRRAGPETIALERFDAIGELTIPADHPGQHSDERTGAALYLPADHPGQHSDERTGAALYLPADKPSPVRRPIHGWFRVGDSPNSLEAAIRIGTSVALPRHGGLIVHASAVAADGHTSIFAGKSGAGKSTLATMLKVHIPTLEAISDELLVIAPTGPSPNAESDSPWEAHVTPFLGSSELKHGLRRPLRDINFLVQAPHHRRIALDRGQALREFLRHVLVYVAEPATAARVLATAAQLVAMVPCYRLEFAKNPAVAGVLGIT